MRERSAGKIPRQILCPRFIIFILCPLCLCLSFPQNHRMIVHPDFDGKRRCGTAVFSRASPKQPSLATNLAGNDHSRPGFRRYPLRVGERLGGRHRISAPGRRVRHAREILGCGGSLPRIRRSDSPTRLGVYSGPCLCGHSSPQSRCVRTSIHRRVICRAICRVLERYIVDHQDRMKRNRGQRHKRNGSSKVERIVGIDART
jgi:hypothetical protein